MNTELTPNTTLGHYRIISKLGAGGMGEVYLAQDTKLDRKVALKILPPEFANDSGRMSRFIREAKSASALNHPNIITIHEIGEFASAHFIATEYITGETLHTRQKQQPLDLKTTLEIAIQVASALDAAHRVGIVHRDIKPENVMIRPDGLVKVLDFGIAKLTELKVTSVDAEAATAVKPQSTTPGMIVGTANYMSPEQARGKEVDARSDIFSFGIVLHEMLSGKQAFTGESAMDVLGAILHKEPTPLNQILPGLPHEVERIVNKTLRKDLDERYQTARDLLTDLKNAKQDLDFQDKLERTSPPLREESKSQLIAAPTTDRPPAPTSSAEFITGEIKKHKLGLVLGLLLMLALIGAGVWFLFLRSSADTTTINSIAVLPFENKSGNTDSDYLSDGIAESLIYRLSQLPNLKVSPANSVFRYKGKNADVKTIASELGVSAVMVGRMSQRGDDFSISVELIDAANNKLLWGEQYDRKSSDLLITQREIAAAIVQKLQLRITGNEAKGLTKKYTDNNEAYQLYLRGRFYWNKRNAENLRKAIDQFQAASEKDPNFALAYVGLADCYVILPFYENSPSPDVLTKAKSYALRALEIDPNLGEAHASLAYTHYMLWSWAEAEPEFKRGVELSPNYAIGHKWYGNYLEDMSRDDESLREFRKAQELDPLSMIIAENIADRYLGMGDLESAYAQCLKVIDLDPNYPGAYRVLSLVYLKQGRNAEAVAAAQRAVELSKRSGIHLGVLGYIYAQTNKRDEALNLIKELEQQYAKGEAHGYHLATIYAGLGDRDRTFAWLEKDFASHTSTLVAWMNSTPLGSVQDDPRMLDLRRSMGLPQ